MKKINDIKIKRIDDYGRVNLPIRFRKTIGVICGQYIKMKVVDNKILIEKLK